MENPLHQFRNKILFWVCDVTRIRMSTDMITGYEHDSHDVSYIGVCVCCAEEGEGTAAEDEREEVEEG